MFWAVLIGSAILLGLVLLYWALWVEPRGVRILRYHVELEQLRHPMRLLVLSDLQPNDFHWPPERMGHLFRELSREDPDVVLWLGDYFNAHDKGMVGFMERHPKLAGWVAKHSPVMEEIAHEMTRLPGKLGQVAILGNHDYAWSGDETRRELEDAGIPVLVNEAMEFQDVETGQKLQVLGYDDVSSQPLPDFEALHASLKPGLPTIALSHTPDAFPLLGKGGPRLVFAGHTHGGQVRIPFKGPVIMPVKHKEYDRGWFFDEDRSMLVITGLGTSLPPFRFLCRPEVAVIDLIPNSIG